MELINKITKAYSLRKKEALKYKLQAFRLVHDIADGFPGLTIDVYPQAFHCIVKDKKYLSQISHLESALKNIALELWSNSKFDFYCWDYTERQVRPHPSFGHPLLCKERAELKSQFIIENNLKYEIHLGEDNHTGIFLDQRDNRQFIHSLSFNKRVLNLFSYTASFSVAALAGIAAEVVSVDLSKKTLEWAKRNIILNDLNLHSSKFIAADARTYLKRLEKKNELFDLIICDPPTFSRSKEGVFSSEKNLEDLLHACLKVLAPRGTLFFSLNTQKMNLKEFCSRVNEVCNLYSIVKISYLDPPFDFPKYKGEPHLKACILGK